MQNSRKILIINISFFNKTWDTCFSYTKVSVIKSLFTLRTSLIKLMNLCLKSIMSGSARFIYFLFLCLTNIIFFRHGRTTVGMKTNSPSERAILQLYLHVLCTLGTLPGWMEYMQSCKVIAQDFSQDIFEYPVFCLPPKLFYVSTWWIYSYFSGLKPH